MPDQNPLAGLNAAELAALAKAQAAGVTIVHKDGSSSDVSKATPPAADAAAAAAAADAAAKAAAAKTQSGDVDPKSAAAAAAKATRPEHVPEKFWDAEKGIVNTEALLKSYGELERSRSKPADQQQQATDDKTVPKPAAMSDENKPATEQKPADQQQTPEQQQAARVDAVNAASAEIQKDGKLSDATYATLEKVGYNRATVDEYISGQRARAQLVINEIHAAAGGQEEFGKMVNWGKANYTPAEQKAFDAALRSGDSAQATLAVNGLKARFSADFGRDAQTRVNGDNGRAATGNAFQSQAELMKAMSDERYKKGDTAFHREVAERLAASQRAGIDIGIRIQK